MENAIFARCFWRTPAVRHLAWLSFAPSLASASDQPVFTPPNPEDLLQRLQVLDAHPEPLLNRLARRSNRRLGLYFEDLYSFALQTLWEREILLRNQAIRNNTRTLGELDFIVRDRQSGRCEHHEIAVKFYLGCRPLGRPNGDWLGPDPRDRLEAKLQRLTEHQCPMSQHPLARQLFESHDIERPKALIFLRGYLFYPPGNASPPLPAHVAPDHARGRWLTLSQARRQHWRAMQPLIQLQKPDWLGPIQLCDRDLPLAEPNFLEALTLIDQRQFPLLFAQMQWQEAGFWLEQERFFIVPDGWPGPGEAHNGHHARPQIPTAR